MWIENKKGRVFIQLGKVQQAYLSIARRNKHYIDKSQTILKGIKKVWYK